jgi:metal-responsive CopG/Arc/MetJ family transcriptional regulator
VSDAPRKDHSHAVRAGHDAVSAVKLPQELTAEIDAWAEARQMARSDAIRQLLEIGLQASLSRDTST